MNHYPEIRTRINKSVYVALTSVLALLMAAHAAMGQRSTLVTVNHMDTGSATAPAGSDFSPGGRPGLSADGRFVVFSSIANNLVSNDTNGYKDIFVRDLFTMTTILVSINQTHTASGNQRSYMPAISADGRHVAFTSDAGDLVDNDFNGGPDVFVYDMVTGTTKLVSVNRFGTSSGNNQSFYPVISADGRFIAFLSDASDMADNDSSTNKDIFVRDMTEGTTSLVTVDVSGTGGSNCTTQAMAFNSYPVISDDGRFVVFDSCASNLVSNDTNGIQQDVFARDLQEGTTILVSRNFSHTGSGNNHSSLSRSPVISADGKFVAFESSASNLTRSPSPGSNIYVYNLATDATTLVSVNMAGTAPGNFNSGMASPLISSDGRFVVFVSRANDITANDSGSNSDVFIRDMVEGETTMVTVDSAGNSTVYDYGSVDNGIALSADGRFVVFHATAELISNGPAFYGLAIRDLEESTTTLLSINRTGDGPGNGDMAPTNPLISRNGLYVVFESGSSNLVYNDSNGRGDVFVTPTVDSGIVQLSSNNLVVNESSGTASITVNRTGGSRGKIGVHYATSNGTAVAGKDYAARSGELTFADGEISKTITIPITNDSIDEVNESLNIKLSFPTGGTLISFPYQAVLTINDNDAPPMLSINDVTVTEGNTGTVKAAFKVTLSQASSKTVTVRFATANQTAVASRDYVAASGILSFAPGQKVKTVIVQVKGDTLQESNETFFVNLSNNSNASISDARGVCTILNND